MKIIALSIVALLWASPARASELTFENLWPYAGVDMTVVGVAMWSAEGESIWFYETLVEPVAPGGTFTLELPSSLAFGFRFNWLDVAGVCPQNCGWGTSVTDVRTGAWIGDELRVVNALWPTYDGGWGPAVRMTFIPDAVQSVPEPATLALLGIGMGLAALRRRASRHR